MTEASKVQGATGSTSAVQPATQPQEMQTALDQAGKLEGFARQLKAELRTYGAPGSVGRDAIQLTTYLRDIHNCEVGIAQAMAIPWLFGPTTS